MFSEYNTSLQDNGREDVFVMDLDEEEDEEFFFSTISTKQKVQYRVDTRNIIAPPLDFSFSGLASPGDALNEFPRKGGRPLTAMSKVTQSKALRLNNNSLSDYSGLGDLISEYFTGFSAICWLDLSFNMITTVSRELLKLDKLQILYLHGNIIITKREIEKLHKLETLRHLTLHGNPVENEKNYRHQILAILPQLKKLDFSDVSHSERFVAEQILESNARRLKTKRKY